MMRFPFSLCVALCVGFLFVGALAGHAEEAGASSEALKSLQKEIQAQESASVTQASGEAPILPPRGLKDMKGGEGVVPSPAATPAAPEGKAPPETPAAARSPQEPPKPAGPPPGSGQTAAPQKTPGGGTGSPGAKPGVGKPGHTKATPSPAPSSQGVDTNRILPGDTLEILVPGQREMSQDYDVDPEGNIYLLSVGRVPVKGLDIQGISDLLDQKLSKYMNKGEQVRIRMVEQKRYVMIFGGVRYPGWYRLSSPLPLKTTLQVCGGLLSDVDAAKIAIKRPVGQTFQTIAVGETLTLMPNDVIDVPMPGSYEQTVDAGDLLFISVPGRKGGTPDGIQDVGDVLKERQVEVDRNGYLYIPGMDRHLYVVGMTTPKIEEAIREGVPKYLAQSPKIRVAIIEKRQYIQVLGHVHNPGLYSVKESENAQAALNTAGGAVDGAVMSDACILRKRGEGMDRIKINLYQFTITGDPRLLTPMHEGDVLFVPISANFGNIKRTLMPWTPPQERLEQDTKNKVRVFGAVNNPGIYEPDEDMTLLDLMVKAGGETDDADLSKILIIRKNIVEVVFNLEMFLKGESPDPVPKIKNGDTVYIKFVEKTVFEPKEDKVFYVVGKVRRPDQYKLSDFMTVFQGISLAGGLDEWADADNITIVRMVNGKQENIPFNFDKAIRGLLPEKNIHLMANDTIYVP